jgi:hypothetical protein
MDKRSGPDTFKLVLLFFAAGNLANAAWMLIAPEHWYFNLPARVPGTGPLNEHFLRDIGCVFGVMGIGLAAAARVRAYRVPVMLGVTGWYGLHALVHVYDTARGALGPEYWRVDLVGVYLPAVLLVAITFFIRRAERLQA